MSSAPWPFCPDCITWHAPNHHERMRQLFGDDWRPGTQIDPMNRVEELAVRVQELEVENAALRRINGQLEDDLVR